MVEAAVASALSRFEGQMVGVGRGTPIDEDDEVEDLLEAFEDSLVLGENQ